jgi:type I restriction enzyme S subunit
MNNNTIEIPQTVQVPNGYKQTTIGLIPSDWEVKKLREIILEAKLGGNYENSESNEGIPVIKMGNIGRGNMNISKIQNLPLNEKYNADDILKKGDLLFNTRNTLDLVGKVAIWDNEIPFALYNSNLLRLVFKTEFVASNWFMNYSLNSVRSLVQLRGFATGTTSVAAIYGRDLNHLKLPLPPLPEQQKIAAILSTWDKAIDNCKAIIEELKVRNKGLTQKMFTGNFEKKCLSEIFERVTTKNTEKNQNVITISAQRGFVKQTDFFNKIIASNILDHYTLVNKGDFCYNKSYSNGYDWGATKRLNDFEKAVVTTLYICFRLKDENHNSGNFFEYYFESEILYKGLSKVANEGGRAHGLLNVTASDFFNIKIGVPTFEEQKAIANILDKATEELNQYQQKLQALQLQKKGLMQQLLTGKVRVKI